MRRSANESSNPFAGKFASDSLMKKISENLMHNTKLDEMITSKKSANPPSPVHPRHSTAVKKRPSIMSEKQPEKTTVVVGGMTEKSEGNFKA